jgi:hypothetical protein
VSESEILFATYLLRTIFNITKNLFWRYKSTKGVIYTINSEEYTRPDKGIKDYDNSK